MLLTVAGDQVPVIPLFDVVGKIGADELAQNEFGSIKDGVIIGFTVTWIAVLAETQVVKIAST